MTATLGKQYSHLFFTNAYKKVQIVKLHFDQMCVCVCGVLSVPKCLLLASDKTCWAQWHFLFQSSDEGVSGDVTEVEYHLHNSANTLLPIIQQNPISIIIFYLNLITKE